jgi:hypothetical protein
MPVFHKLRGTRENSFSIGDGSPGIKTLSFLTNDSNKPALRWNPSPGRLEGLDSAAISYAIPKLREESRTLPSVVGNYIEIGTFTFASGVFSFHIVLLGSNGVLNVAKEYALSVAVREIAYTTLVPVIDTGAAGGHNFELELGASSGTVTLRLRRTSGTSTMGVLARILILGSDAASYASLSGTGTSTASGIYPIGIGANAITYDDSLVAPPLSVDTVQDALDFLKSSGRGDLIPLSMPGMSEGDFGYVSGPSTLSKTDAAAEEKAVFAGAHIGVTGRALACGLVEHAKFSVASTTPTYGDRVFLARADDEGGGAAAGKLTTIAPTTGFIAEVGVVSDVDLVHYPTTLQASVILHPKVLMGRA